MACGMGVVSLVLTVTVAAAYLWFLVRELDRESSPLYGGCDSTSSSSSRRFRRCWMPRVPSYEGRSMDLWIRDDPGNVIRPLWVPVESCRALPLVDGQVHSDCRVVLPSWARARGRTPPLMAQFRLDVVDSDENDSDLTVETPPFALTRMVELGHDPDPDPHYYAGPEQLQVPHFKYGRQERVVVRWVTESRSFAVEPRRIDGVRYPAMDRHNPNYDDSSNWYGPRWYVDETALRYSGSVPMARSPPGTHTHHNNTNANTNTGMKIMKSTKSTPTNLTVVFTAVSPRRDLVLVQLGHVLDFLSDYLLPTAELDEVRYFLRDDRFHRFLVTQVVGILHTVLHTLAFRDEYRFYRGKCSGEGVSVGSIVLRVVSSLILLLYLTEGATTSFLVWVPLAVDIVLQLYKVWKLCGKRTRRTFVSSPKHSHLTVVGDNDDETLPNTNARRRCQVEMATLTYDRLACLYLVHLVGPVLVGTTLYSYVQSVAHHGTLVVPSYSWCLSHAADLVYATGFLMQCPQLYINYRLQSVAHLPPRVLAYKLFHTFVDDLFALLVEMPWKHRLMTLRDDVIFVIYLYQAYRYRSDRSRPNEYGYVYDDDDQDDDTHNDNDMRPVGNSHQLPKDGMDLDQNPPNDTTKKTQ